MLAIYNKNLHISSKGWNMPVPLAMQKSLKGIIPILAHASGWRALANE